MRFVKLICLGLLLTFAVTGQTNKGGISGTVSDSKGAAIAGATVKATNSGTNRSVTAITNEDGSFSFSSLDPVMYSLTIEAKNFKVSRLSNVKVDTATTQTVDVVLETGQISESVLIEADANLVNTESGTVSQTINERQLRDLPLNNRSVLDLAVTMPNVSGDAGSEDVDANSNQPVPGFNLSINGGRPGSSSILADGVNNTGVGLARAVVSFTPETVQEFTVQSSAYSAEYGTSGGGIINVTTKSGTNAYNGTALWYHRNPVTNASPWRQGTAPRPANNLRYNQVSLSVGGPIYLPRFGEGGKYLYDGHNKSFFFFAYEPRYRTDFTSGSALLPTAAERAGNFNGLVRTNSGFLPAAVAAQFNQASIGIANIYQQFTLRANGTLQPITLGTGQSYCQFGVVPGVTVGVTTNTAGQPVCTTAYVPNPTLNVIPAAFQDPISLRLIQLQDQPGDYFLDNGLVRNSFITRSVTQNETRYTARIDHNFTDKFKANFRYSKLRLSVSEVREMI